MNVQAAQAAPNPHLLVFVQSISSSCPAPIQFMSGPFPVHVAMSSPYPVHIQACLRTAAVAAQAVSSLYPVHVQPMCIYGPARRAWGAGDDAGKALESWRQLDPRVELLACCSQA